MPGVVSPSANSANPSLLSKKGRAVQFSWLWISAPVRLTAPTAWKPSFMKTSPQPARPSASSAYSPACSLRKSPPVALNWRLTRALANLTWPLAVKPLSR